MPAPAVTIAAAHPEDVPAIYDLIHALADYEKLSHEVTGSAEDLAQHLFGDRPYAETLIARVNDTPIGFALFFSQLLNLFDATWHLSGRSVCAAGLSRPGHRQSPVAAGGTDRHRTRLWAAGLERAGLE